MVHHMPWVCASSRNQAFEHPIIQAAHLPSFFARFSRPDGGPGTQAAGISPQTLDDAGVPEVEQHGGMHLPRPDHRHGLIASQGPPCRWQAAEAKPWPHQPFDAAGGPALRFVQVFALPQPRQAPKFARPPHVRRGTRESRVLVQRDRARIDRVRLDQRFAKETLRSGQHGPRSHRAAST